MSLRTTFYVFSVIGLIRRSLSSHFWLIICFDNFDTFSDRRYQEASNQQMLT